MTCTRAWFSLPLCLGLLSGAACASGSSTGSGGSGGLGSCDTATAGGEDGSGGSKSSSGGGEDAVTTASTGGGSTSVGTSSGATTGATTSGGGGGGQGGAPGEGVLVINEISAEGDDYIELFNAGDADLDVGDLRIADQDTPGVPKLADAITIPAGTSLEAGAYLFILADQADASDGFIDACDPGPAPCLAAAFGISKDGDGIFVLEADDAVRLSEVYPADAATLGESWGRLPNGTGAFAVNAPTPGADNEAP